MKDYKYPDLIDELRAFAAEEYMYLGDLVDEILNHLAQAPPLFQKMIAESIFVDDGTDEGLLDRIREMLTDPNTDGCLIAYVGSELLGRTFTYQEDSVFHVARNEAQSATNA
ncbi:hypothetical protein E5S70_26895 [Ensifer adhaerens]|uniref:hypothetical protein n=1 Tax=Ensifer canadensis TaxID=555315 RepID=UPI00148FF587|nr:hypothetical protein [Ensifer canadensis]NOV19658.1 hypothetical protein [Ensifer canadensis]